MISDLQSMFISNVVGSATERTERAESRSHQLLMTLVYGRWLSQFDMNVFIESKVIEDIFQINI